MENFIGIDPSKISTAMALQNDRGTFLFNYTKEKPNYKWIKATQNLINCRFIEYYTSDNYSENEIFKLQTFSHISNLLLNDLQQHLDPQHPTIIGMEGYSYGYKTSPGPIIDLVGLGQSIRLKLWENQQNFKLEKLEIISPSSLKSLICEMVYGKPEITLNKRTGEPLKNQPPSRSPYGMAGGSFEKIDIFKAMLDGKIESPIYEYCTQQRTELEKIKSKSFVKPFDDVNDAIMLLKIMQSGAKRKE